MKFAWKMIALVSLLLALALAAGGILSMQGPMRRELDTALEESREDMRLFSMTLQALCLRENDGREPEDVVRSVLRSCGESERYSYCVYGGDGSPIASAGTVHAASFSGGDVGAIRTVLERQDGRFYAVSRQRLPLLGSEFGLERRKDVTEIFSRARGNLQAYRLGMLVILLVGVGLTTAFTLVLTRPIRRISRTAKQLSQGQYDKRAAVRGSDELGQLARDFNAMAEALEQKIRELEDAAQRQKEFTASFAHELKTPLTSVIGYADTLRSRVLPPEQQMEAAGYILSEGRRLEAMSFALLDLFSLERRAPEMERVNLRRLLESVRDSLRYPLQSAGVRMELQCPEMDVTAAPELMKVLVYNLADNARKASPPGGVILLRAERTGDGGCRVSVRDQGPGIPPEALARITEPFFMVDKSRARAQGGAGLGLTLCQKIAEVHGGRLEFESAAGKGTCASLVLGGGTV